MRLVVFDDTVLQGRDRPYRQRPRGAGLGIDAMPIRRASLVVFIHPLPTLDKIGTLIIEADVMILGLPCGSVGKGPLIHFLTAMRAGRGVVALHVESLSSAFPVPPHTTRRPGGLPRAPRGEDARRKGLHRQSMMEMTGLFAIVHSPVLGFHVAFTKTFQLSLSIFGKSDLK